MSRPPKQPGTLKEKLCVSFNPILFKQLKEYADATSRTQTEIIEQSFREFLNRNTKK